MKNDINFHWGFVFEAIVIGLLIGRGIESCGKHIGKGISEINITIVQGATNSDV